MSKWRQRRFMHGPPTWWPEGATWSPRDGRRPAFRRRYMLWMLIPISLLLLVVIGTTAFFTSSIDHGPGAQSSKGWDGPPFAGIVFSVIIFWLLIRFVRRAAAPLADLMEAADQVAAGDYTTRIEPRGPRDFRQMAGAFNEMTRRLEANEEQRRRLLADVTHELRTPLAIIRGNVEGMLDGLYPRDDLHLAPIVDETTQMARLLDDLHTLATAEAGALRLHREPTDVRELVTDIVAAFTPRALEQRASLDLQCAQVPEIDLDPVRLRQVIENVLANALRYTPSGGRVSIEVSHGSGLLTVVIADTGPGVPAEALDHLFDRFTKSADSGGSGLGLAIARSLTEAHGGKISAENRAGGGLSVRLTILIDVP